MTLPRGTYKSSLHPTIWLPLRLWNSICSISSRTKNIKLKLPSPSGKFFGSVPRSRSELTTVSFYRDLHNTPSSRIYKIRTPKDEQTTTLPPQIPIEPDLEISDINATWVTVVWRKFTEYELQVKNKTSLSKTLNLLYFSLSTESNFVTEKSMGKFTLPRHWSIEQWRRIPLKISKQILNMKLAYSLYRSQVSKR